jgi:hypothetical protein
MAFRDTTFLTHEMETIVAQTDTVDPRWAYPHPTRVSMQALSDSVKLLRVPFHYRPDTNSIVGSIAVRITSHRYFLEFELVEVTGDCGEIWVFGPRFVQLPQDAWPGWHPPMIRTEYSQITYLGNGYYAGLTAANPNTGIARSWVRYDTVFIAAISPLDLPGPPGYSHRNQRFAFFLCREEDLKNRVREVETYFNYPYGVSLKDNPENNIDYLFLIDQSYVSAQNIIRLCDSTGLGAVLLYQGFWSAWKDTTEPFKLQPWTANLIDTLKAAGLVVGLHAYVHLVPDSGYFWSRYPGSVSTCIIDGTFRSMDWRTHLPDSVVYHFVNKVEALRPDWLYLDGQEKHYECRSTYYDIYLDGRQTWAVMKELRRRNYNNLKIFQDAGGTLSYNFKSRIGQTDYWSRAPWTSEPVPHMLFTESQVIHRRRGLYRYTDLGWFGREIHDFISGRRDARRGEWDTLAMVSERANIPIGIRTTYNDFRTDSLYHHIVPLLRQTIQRRRGTTGLPHSAPSPMHFALDQNYPNPFNPTTTIGYQVSSTSHVTLKIYDILGREVATLVNQKREPGKYTVRWDASGAASGVYFYRMQAGDFVTTKKLVVIR